MATSIRAAKQPSGCHKVWAFGATRLAQLKVTEGDDHVARKRVAFTWQVLQDQLEADDDNARPLFLPDAMNQHASMRAVRVRRRIWLVMIGLLLCATLGAGYRLYLTAEAGATVLEAELQDALLLDSYRTVNLANGSKPTPPLLQSFDLHDDVAAVKVVVDDATWPSPYRDTRFYWQAAGGWQLATKELRFWGPAQQLESKHFIFRYRRRDDATVTAAAPALDALYSQLYQVLSRPMPTTDEKITIWVFASYADEARDLPVPAHETIQIPSPGLLQLPIDVSDSEVIALYAGISVVDRLLPRTSADWLDTGVQPVGWWWQPLTEGLRLWLLWDTNPLLARWHQELLASNLAILCSSCLRQPESLWASYLKSCQMLAMLGLYSVDAFSIPCTGTFGNAGGNTSISLSPQLLTPQVPSGLATLAPGTSTSQLEESLLYKSYGGQMILMAALLEYVKNTYGQEKISALLTAFGTYHQWDTLMPAVFGISAEEFNAEWRIYLAKQYGIDKLLPIQADDQ